MVVGIVVVMLLSLTTAPLSAQRVPCSSDFVSCLETAKTRNYDSTAVQPCCQSIAKSRADEKPCFCGFVGQTLTQQNGETILNGIFGTCGITDSARTICDDSCWGPIWTCLEPAKAQDYPPAAVSPCCPTIKSTITNDQACFCYGGASLASQSSGLPIFNRILQTCGFNETLTAICSVNNLRTPSGPTTAPSGPAPAPSDGPAPAPSDGPAPAPGGPTSAPAPSPA